MGKLAAVLLGCLLLTGCAANWQQDLRYKILSVNNKTPTEYFDLELVGDAPKGSLEPGKLKSQLMQTNLIKGAEVGDEVLCSVEQEKGNAFGNSNVVTHLKNCKKA
ncbi:hypothetical protein [Lentzea flaviverrucosa]|uniref:Lipoprotein n=1 Tax=Lentzea flaviverrucosa TaxID=200379 RepID=A0A1H9PLR9_9PSEU|nr:hypothetical protein [Lentzea flaviverrucosa]RDI29818.1 hypothetical protein DFR72_105237 [Lentzea flaviverrucosa]SER48523.1 hypothetical protein SAMN05216195_105335 [Lentzea flaviverrucosa]